MRIVELIGFIVALIALFALLFGRPHTLASVRAAHDAAGDRHDGAQPADDADRTDD